MTKVVAEKILEYHAPLLGLNAITLRPTNVYGSSHDPPERVVPRFIANTLADEPIEVYGGDQVLDLLHISDAVDGIVKATSILERMTGRGYYDVFNLATGTPHSLNDVIGLVSLYTGRSVDPIRSESRSFDVRRYVGDTEKARGGLGFQAKISLEEGIQATIEEYKACAFKPNSKIIINELNEGLSFREAVN
jgi:nucleoside-diphosphate-sugar epimerase